MQPASHIPSSNSLSLLEGGETLRESEERYRLLIDTARDVIFSLATDGTFTSLNPSFETFTGWSRAEWLGRSFEGLIAEADGPRALDLFNRVLRGETLRAIRLRVHTRAGETLVVELNMSPQTQDGRAVGLLGIARDMTEEQRAEDALKASEERFRALTEATTDGLVFHDKGQIVDVNPALVLMFGYEDASEMVGRGLLEFVAPVSRELVLKQVQSDSPQPYEAFGLRKDGSVFPVEASARLYEYRGRTVRVASIHDTTERRQAEEALRASEERFRALIEHGADQISLVAPDGTLLYENPTATRPLGYPPGAFLGHSLFGLVHPDDLARAQQTWKEVLDDLGVSRQAAFRLRHADGSWRWMEGTAANLLNNPSVRAVVINYRDITERKQVEEALQEAEARYRTLAEQIPAVMYVDAPDEAGTAIYVSPQVEALLGYSLAEWEQDPYFWRKRVHPADYERAVGIIHATLSQGRASEEYRMVARDGRAVWVRDESVLLRNAAGQPLFVQGFLVDVTDRKQAEDNLQRRAEELTALYHITYDLTVQTDVNVLLRTIARRASALLGVPESGIFLFDPIKKDLEIVASTNDIAPIGFRLKLGEGLAGRVAESRQPMIVEDYSQWEGRSERLKDAPFASYLQVPMLYQGELIGVLGVYDIHRAGEPPDAPKRKFTEADANLLSLFASAAAGAVYGAHLHQQVQRHAEELAEANARLTELDALKTKFVSNVSHELRTPVTNLGLYLNLLERGRPEKRAQYMTVLQEQTVRLAQLIEDILDLSRLERDRERLVFEPVDLNTLADRVITAQLPRAEAASLRLTFDPDLDLPPVRGETNRLTQVVTNLVANAINYTPSGSVQVSTRCAGERACVEVQDTGLGIDAEDLPYIFERFYRGRRVTKSNIPGTGLGLGIVKEIVELHGGAVEVESRVGEGSTFRIWLPLGSAD